MSSDVLLLLAGFLATAFLYSSVGHGGGSGYLAVMALAGIEPVLMRPAALTMNTLVSGLAFIHFARQRSFSWNIFWPFAITAVPFAFVGARLTLPGRPYKILLGLVLIFAAWRLIRGKPTAQGEERPLCRYLALGLGSATGFLAGITGIGGGIFLSPLLILRGWANPRTASGVAAAFVFVNSVAGLLAMPARMRLYPSHFSWWLAMITVGGWAGSKLGSSRFGSPLLVRLLGMVLLLAAAKLLLFS
jgi:uncharacterized membrane protein YfcA